jgi:hypothetical protein
MEPIFIKAVGGLGLRNPPSLAPSLSLYEMKIYANTYEGGFGL